MSLKPFMHNCELFSTVWQVTMNGLVQNNVQIESTGSINYQPTSIRQRNARSIENIAAVRDSVRENPRRSISCRLQELGLSTTSIWRILHRDLGLHPYEIQLTQTLKVNDHTQHRVFVDWVLRQLAVDPNFAKKSSLMTRPIFG
ncbi:hypothetical protein QTP88_008998 [Uroleucon formosanum]